MSALASFYSTLLTIQVTVFGIITAAVFVFLQIGYAASHRHSLRLLSDRLLVTYFLFSTATLLFTAAGTLLLSLQSHNYVSFLNVGIRTLFRNPWAPAVLLLFTGLCVGLFGLIVHRNLKYLHPQRILLWIGQRTKPDDIRLFLVREYGLDAPTPCGPRVALPDALLKQILPFLQDSGPEPSEAEKAQVKVEMEAATQRYEEASKRFDQLKKSAASATDPLDIVSAVVFTAIKSSDFQTLREAGETLRHLSGSLLDSIKAPAGAKNQWNPDKRVAEYWTEHVIRFVSSALEVAEKEGLRSASVTILGMTEDLSTQLLEGHHVTALLKLMGYWKRAADNAIANNKSVFIWVVKTYESIGSVALERDLEEPRNQTFGDLGWLGERLLEKKGFESKPVMYDTQYSTEYDELMNILLTFGSTYSSKFPNAYPLIYFDAIWVVFCKLVLIRCMHPEIDNLKNDIFSCTSKVFSFVEPALRASNARGAALAVTRLSRFYDELIEKKLDDCAADVVDLLVHVASIAAALDEKSTPVEFLPEGIVEHVVKVLASSPFHKPITTAIREALIKSHGPEHDKVWGFITKLGKMMGTNFGFMFDWATGNLYPEDDPRRRATD